ncbi:MAG: hypothetical protein U0163_10090 [Gemmatimonadaceae bacterium]
MSRHIAGIVAGYLFFGICSGALFRLSGVDPHATPTFSFALLATVAGMVFAALAGFFAATVSTRGGVAARHLAIVVAVVGLAFAAIGRARGSVWSELVTALVLAPCVWAGGLFADRRTPGARLR